MSEPVTVNVKLFAMVREIVGREELLLTVSGNPPTVHLVREHLLAEYPALLPLLPFSQISVNEEIQPDDAVLSQGDEVAVLPPVSGG